MGLLNDNNQDVDVKIDAPVTVIKTTKKGAIIVCPNCKGIGKEYWEDYAGREYGVCQGCGGQGAIEVKVKAKK